MTCWNIYCYINTFASSFEAFQTPQTFTLLKYYLHVSPIWLTVLPMGSTTSGLLESRSSGAGEAAEGDGLPAFFHPVFKSSLVGSESVIAMLVYNELPWQIKSNKEIGDLFGIYNELHFIGAWTTRTSKYMLPLQRHVVTLRVVAQVDLASRQGT